MSAELRRAAQRMIDFQRQKQDGSKKQKSDDALERDTRQNSTIILSRITDNPVINVAEIKPRKRLRTKSLFQSFPDLTVKDLCQLLKVSTGFDRAHVYVAIARINIKFPKCGHVALKYFLRALKVLAAMIEQELKEAQQMQVTVVTSTKRTLADRMLRPAPTKRQQRLRQKKDRHIVAKATAMMRELHAEVFRLQLSCRVGGEHLEAAAVVHMQRWQMCSAQQPMPVCDHDHLRYMILTSKLYKRREAIAFTEAADRAVLFEGTLGPLKDFLLSELEQIADAGNNEHDGPTGSGIPESARLESIVQLAQLYVQRKDYPRARDLIFKNFSALKHLLKPTPPLSSSRSSHVSTGRRSSHVSTGSRSSHVSTGSRSSHVSTGRRSSHVSTGRRSSHVSTGSRSSKISTGSR